MQWVADAFRPVAATQEEAAAGPFTGEAGEVFGADHRLAVGINGIRSKPASSLMMAG